MKHTTLLAVGIALALPMCAHSKKHSGAQRSSEELEATFKRKDKNHDGYLTREEYTFKARNFGKSTRNFIKKDKNGDGKLTRTEFSTKLARNG